MMTATVRECMNPQLVYVRAGTRPEVALMPILNFGIMAAPVLDEDDRPVGMVSLRDLVDPRKRGARVSRTVPCVGADESIASAARRLTELGEHQLVVLDKDGRAIGILSACDIVRGLIGVASKHPPAIEAFGRPARREIGP